MGAGLQEYIGQIELAREHWQTARPSLGSGVQYNGRAIETRYIDRWFDELIRLFRLADEQEDPDMAVFTVQMNGLASQCQQLVASASQIRTNPAAHGPTFVNTLWGLRTIVLWLLPVGATWEGWPSRQGEIRETLESLSGVYSEAIRYISEGHAVKDQLDALQASLPKAKDLMGDIQKVIQDIVNAKSSAEGNASSAAAKKEEADEHAKALAELVVKQNEQLQYFENQMQLIEKTLAGASAIALGSSFGEQRVEHESSKKFWTWSFYVGLAVMIALELVAAFKPDYFPSLTNDTWLTWLLSRVVIISPVIWFTWFAALQYSRAMRLSEDYAFKTAAAKSFYGYRKEVGSDEELVRLLQEISIKNFGSNPIRLIGKDDHGSPIHALVEKLSSKVDTDVLAKFADTLKAFVEKKPTGKAE